MRPDPAAARALADKAEAYYDHDSLEIPDGVIRDLIAMLRAYADDAEKVG